MKVSDLDFDLPKTLIADRPPDRRDSCRLMVLHRDGSTEHRRFHDLPHYLSEGDLLILNNTKVFPARLCGTKKTGGKIELLLVGETELDSWEVLCRERYSGRISFSEELSGEMLQGKILRFNKTATAEDFMTLLWKIGSMPLPPYIKRDPDERDKDGYQTVFASEVGSIAAPTAGLHFTSRLIDELRSKGVMVRFLTLHIGIGTFKPVVVEEVKDHTMSGERFFVERKLLQTIEEVKKARKKVISVGTTTTRALEGIMSGRFIRHQEHSANGTLSGTTDIFIYPGYVFRAIDCLLTNFHLPRSTPLMLSAAFTGKENLLPAYRSAVSMGYRFFSYGDAMLLS